MVLLASTNYSSECFSSSVTYSSTSTTSWCDCFSSSVTSTSWTISMKPFIYSRNSVNSWSLWASLSLRSDTTASKLTLSMWSFTYKSVTNYLNSSGYSYTRKSVKRLILSSNLWTWFSWSTVAFSIVFWRLDNSLFNMWILAYNLLTIS